MYITCLAVQLQPYRPRQAAATTAMASMAAAADTSSLKQILQGQHELAAPDARLHSLLEKAYNLCAETCLVPDSLTSWDTHVSSCLEDAKFDRPASLNQVSDIALSPTVFCMYAVAHLWALGNAADLAKLHSIQQALRRRGTRKASSQTQALQALSAALPAATQLAFEKQIMKLEPQVDTTIHTAQNSAVTLKLPPAAEAPSAAELKHTLQGAPGGASLDLTTSQADVHDATASQMELTADSPMADQAEQHVAPAEPQQAATEVQQEAAASQQPAVASQQEASAPQHDAVASQQEAAAPDHAELPASRARAPVVKTPAAADAADPACKPLLTEVFELLKRYHVWWKANAGKAAEAAQPGSHVDKTKADELLSRCACLSV